MVQDEILDEVWRIRDEYARSFNYDLDAIFSDLKRREAQSGREHVKLPAKKPGAIPTARDDAGGK
jgi:hypothetical protein